MTTIQLPEGCGLPLRMDLVQCANIARPDYFNGMRRLEVQAYEDDLVAKVRRVVRVKLYFRGAAKRPAPHGHQLEVFQAYGYDNLANVWGHDGSKSAHRELEPKEAKSLLDSLNNWIVANLHPYKGGPSYYSKKWA